MESNRITFKLILVLFWPPSTFFKTGGKLSTWKISPHLRKRKLNPLSKLVLTAVRTVRSICFFDNRFHFVTAFPILGSTEDIRTADEPQTLGLHNRVWSPDSVLWNAQMSG